MICMGDLIENSTRESVGSGVYEQTMDPQQQMLSIIDILEPLSKKNLILGMITGNHEERTRKDSGFDPTIIMARSFQVPYLRYGAFIKLRCGSMNYIVYATHGSSGSKYTHTKLAAAMKLGNFVDADIYLYAHTHGLNHVSEKRKRVNLKNKTVEEYEVHYVLTGSFLGYDDSYADMKDLPPSVIGYPVIRFSSGKRRIEIETVKR